MALTKINRDATVKQSNSLVVARYRLTLAEQRLMYAIVSQIKKNEEHFEKLRISISDIAELCGMDGKRKYSDIRKVSVKLLQRLVAIPTVDGGEYITHWLQSQRYFPSDCSIEFQIDGSLRQELLQLKKAYVDTPVAVLVGFKTLYASRMYLILKKMLKVGDFEYDLDFFRKTFQLADTYNKFSNIKNGVLEPALKEINEKSDLEIKHEYIKEGRFYKKIRFVVKLKEEEQSSIEIGEPPEIEDKGDGMSKDEKEIFSKITNPSKWNISSDMAQFLINDYGVERVKRNLIYCDKHRTGKHSLGGFLVEMIRMDAAEDEKQRKAEKKREDEKQKRRNEGILKEILNRSDGADPNVAENSENNISTGFPKDKIAELKERIGAAK